MHRSSGYSAASANLFANLTGSGAAQPQQQAARKKGAAPPPAQHAIGMTAAEAEAAAERKRQKNRQKRLKRKQAAARGKSGQADEEDEDDESNDDDDEDDEHEEAAPAAPKGSAAVAKDEVSSEEEEEAEEAEEESEESTSETEEEEEEEEEDDEDEEDASESDSSDAEEEDEDADAAIERQVVSLGHDAALVATARAQLASSGIPINAEMLLLATQQEEALANERRTGKHTVFKPKQAPAPAPAPTKQPAAVVKPAKVAAVAAKPAAVPASRVAASSRPASAVASVAPVSAAAAPPAATAVPVLVVPRHDHSVAGLERLAGEWNPLPLAAHADAIAMLEEWGTLLERAQRGHLGFAAAKHFDAQVAEPRAAAFATAFHNSQALELLVRRMVSDVFASADPAEAARVRATEAPLLRLLSYSIPGRRPVDHKYLIDSWRSLGRQLSRSTPGPARAALLDQIVKVVSAARRVGATHRQIEAALTRETQHNSGAFATTPAEVEAAALAELSKHAIDPALFFGAEQSNGSAAAPFSRDSSVRHMLLASTSSGTALSGGEDVLQGFQSVIAAAPQHSLQLTMHLLEKEIQNQMALAARALEQHAGQSNVVDTQRSALDTNRTRELAVHVAAGREQSAREAELLKRKAELLNELDSVNNSLAVVARAREASQRQTAAIEEQYARNRASLSALHSSTLARTDALRQDAQAAQAIHGLIVGSYERLRNSNEQALQKVVTANAAATSRHLQGAAQHLQQQAALINFLQRRADFCAGKLKSMASERAEAARFGVSAMHLGAAHAQPDVAERNLARMVQQDKALAASRTAAGNALLRRLVKQAATQADQERNGAAAPIPPAQVAQLYTTLQRSLDQDKDKSLGLVFDLAPLSQLVQRLQLVAQGGNASASNGAAAAAPAAAPAAPIAVAAVPAVLSSSMPLPIGASANDPFVVAAGQPRKSIKQMRQEKEAAKQAAEAQGRTQTQQQSQSQGDRKGNGVTSPAASARNQPRTSAAAVGVPTSSATPPVATPSPVVTPPVRSWSTSVSPAPAPAATNTDAFPELRAHNAQTNKQQQQQQQAKQTGATAPVKATNGTSTSASAATPSAAAATPDVSSSAAPATAASTEPAVIIEDAEDEE